MQGIHLGDIVVTGFSIGLPNASTGRAVFDPSNAEALMRGESFIGSVPAPLMQAQLDRNVVQVRKGTGGLRERRPLTALHEVIQLASRLGHFDLSEEYSIASSVTETLDTTYALAIAAGLEVTRLHIHNSFVRLFGELTRSLPPYLLHRCRHWSVPASLTVLSRLNTSKIRRRFPQKPGNWLPVIVTRQA